ncbi:pyridoxamine kinase [Lachnospiraceae bacterium 62-35]
MAQDNHNHQTKIAVINDFSGFGRCSLAVELPIISQMKIQCCPIPTSIFSNHTGFSHFFFDDYTDNMEPYIQHWKELDLRFSGILTGFLGSERQIDIVRHFIEDFQDSHTLIIIDPVMGDNGKPYSTYTPAMCEAMKSLVSYADVLLPNLTEACILTDTPYKADGWKPAELFEMAEKLSQAGAEHVVISGIHSGQYVSNAVYESGHIPSILRTKRVGHTRSGTGDIFASIIAADCVKGVNLKKAVSKAALFIKKCIIATEKLDIPMTDGVCFEEVLHTLK